MTSLRETIEKLFSSVKPLEPGMYHFQAPPADPRNYRLHLRLESDGSGVLIVNASTVLHLNQTAAECAYHLVQGKSEEEAANALASRYRISYQKAKQDYADFMERLDTLVTTPDLDPVIDLEFERQRPYTGAISAPYRLDCALTYRLPEGSDPEFAPLHRAKDELGTAEWKELTDKAWEAGIPHLIFTGGEPTLREDLFELLAHAEKNGQITGLSTDGLRFSEPGYFEGLLQTGLDHLLVVISVLDPSTLKMLKHISEADIHATIHITIREKNRDEVKGLLEKLAEIGIRAISLTASGPALKGDLQAARGVVAALGMTLIWDVPVPYSSTNPFDLEFEDQERPSGAGRAWLYVEPDGDVLPDQAVDRVLGNLLRDPWEMILTSSMD
jgi:hypothetical protein